MLNGGKANLILTRRADGQYLDLGPYALLERQLRLSGIKAPQIPSIKQPDFFISNLKVNGRVSLAVDDDGVVASILEFRPEPAAQGRMSVPGLRVNAR